MPTPDGKQRESGGAQTGVLTGVQTAVQTRVQTGGRLENEKREGAEKGLRGRWSAVELFQHLSRVGGK